MNCRNPSDHDNPWCYKLPDGAWEDCEVPLCSSITTTTPSSASTSSLTTGASTSKPEVTECLEDAKGKTYRGSVSETVSGRYTNCSGLPVCG